MGLFDLFRRSEAPAAQSRPPAPHASAGQLFTGLDDPDLLEYMRAGSATASGEYVTASRSLHNMALLRSVTLIAESIGMLPTNLVERGDSKRIATDHPVHRLLKVRPNSWQTPYEFKSTLQANALLHGQAYARIIWSRGRPLALIPLDSASVTPRLTDDWRMVYTYSRNAGGTVELQARDVFHLRDLSVDAVNGMSRVKLAREAIGLAQAAERAAARLFKSGVMAGGALSSPNTLSDKAIERLSKSLETKYSGVENAHKWMVLEEGLKPEQWAHKAVDAQHIENRKHQIEEIARAFGIPRPLLMMDDTSWGSGIEQLAIFFVQYAMLHWFTAWEQAAERSLLSDDEVELYHVKFNERALLRGTLKEQGEFFAKALGAGGQAPWMSQNEVRDLSELAKSSDPAADSLRNPMTQPKEQQ